MANATLLATLRQVMFNQARVAPVVVAAEAVAVAVTMSEAMSKVCIFIS